MNSKAFLIPFIAVFAVMFVGFASAQLVNTNTVFGLMTPSGIAASFNDVQLVEGITTPIAGFSGDTIPVRVTFTAARDASDVKVKIWIEGTKDDITASTNRFNLINGSVYTNQLSLQLPSNLDDLSQEFTLHVSVSSADMYDEESFTVRMQRESYSLDLLSVDYPVQVSAGDLIPVSVVVNNNGMETLDNAYVIASITSLGISSRGYFGDLSALDNCSDNCNTQDSAQKVVYLKIPESATAGTYQLDVKVYNKDATTTVSKIINVEQSASTNVLAAVKSQDLKAGETKTYDLIIVNSGDKIKVYNIQVVSGTALSVSAPSIVTVGPESSTTVPITVRALDDAQTGSYTFSVTVDGQQTTFGANIVQGSGVSNSVIALTVVLVVIFLVLLVVLIVLLTRKEKTVEQVETSYY